MGHEPTNEEKNVQVRKLPVRGKESQLEDFVLEKSIFNNIFLKDIRRVYIYKKVERLGKAVHLVAPAFADSVSLRNRIDTVAIGLIDAALLPPPSARIALSRELLALSSILSIARTAGFLSPMNTELITREAHLLLQEIAAYEEPRLLLDEASSLSSIARSASRSREARPRPGTAAKAVSTHSSKGQNVKDIDVLDIRIKDRREAILSVIKNKGSAHIKDISTFIRGVSEKTIQRELSALIRVGLVTKKGERRWSAYSLSAA